MPQQRQAFQRELDVIDAEFERSHHLVAQIASRAGHIRSEDLSPHSRRLVERMGNLVSGMWRQAADSWYQPAHSATAVLGERDDDMDEFHASLMAGLAQDTWHCR